MTFLGERNVLYTGATLELDLMIAIGEGSGIIKAPADPAVRGGGGGGGRHLSEAPNRCLNVGQF